MYDVIRLERERQQKRLEKLRNQPKAEPMGRWAHEQGAWEAHLEEMFETWDWDDTEGEEDR